MWSCKENVPKGSGVGTLNFTLLVYHHPTMILAAEYSKHGSSMSPLDGLINAEARVYYCPQVLHVLE